jgi:hypothetical protein
MHPFNPGALTVRHALLIVVLSVTLPACDARIPEKGNIPLSASTASSNGTLSGTVLEAIPAPPYLYLRLKTASGEVWAAVDGGTVQKGSQVTVENALLMQKFESATLKRTFAEVYFGTLGHSGAGAGTPAANPHANSAPPSTRIPVGTVAKASAPNARTVAETWAERARLDGKSVTIRGVVVKVNEGVMGKNWIHLQDGSGNEAQGTFDITVTSTDMARAGDTVTITGTVRVNKNVGASYSYPVMIEDAKVLK